MGFDNNYLSSLADRQKKEGPAPWGSEDLRSLAKDLGGSLTDEQVKAMSDDRELSGIRGFFRRILRGGGHG